MAPYRAGRARPTCMRPSILRIGYSGASPIRDSARRHALEPLARACGRARSCRLCVRTRDPLVAREHYELPPDLRLWPRSGGLFRLLPAKYELADNAPPVYGVPTRRTA